MLQYTAQHLVQRIITCCIASIFFPSFSHVVRNQPPPSAGHKCRTVLKSALVAWNFVGNEAPDLTSDFPIV